MNEETKGEMKSDLYYLAEAIASIRFLDALLEGQSWQFPDGRTTLIADAHRGDGKRLAGRADEKFALFLEF